MGYSPTLQVGRRGSEGLVRTTQLIVLLASGLAVALFLTPSTSSLSPSFLSGSFSLFLFLKFKVSYLHSSSLPSDRLGFAVIKDKCWASEAQILDPLP